ncbi:MAG TPA: PQQ-dependent sugar dehydrogenase [Gammaproteobacteria bacterium]|nr:PQQ-dependent sugar dehydrogenase [Gammaproteobacteria bacterium]
MARYIAFLFPFLCYFFQVAHADITLRLSEVANGLKNPLYLTSPAGDPRLFIVEQAGRIRIIANGKLLSTPFLDIEGKIKSGGEQGLLSVAFHPDYAKNGFLYVNYTDKSGDTRIERYHVASDPNRADPDSAKLLLKIEQPYANHNGGLNLFGHDGMLYIGMGDGGAAGDPHGNGQNLKTLLGKMLRIDVNKGDPYSIPSDNPYVGRKDARGEIWAYGLRNPWRYAFDLKDNLLYIADVGQNKIEEINVVPASQKGLNYGWNILEGSSCFSLLFSPSCNKSGLVLPVLEYDHDQGCSVIGGFVYRGRAIPELDGHYLYSDYCTGFLKSFKYAGGKTTEQHTWNVGEIGSVLSFGEDAGGELYIMSDKGSVYRLVKDSSE